MPLNLQVFLMNHSLAITTVTSMKFCNGVWCPPFRYNISCNGNGSQNGYDFTPRPIKVKNCPLHNNSNWGALNKSNNLMGILMFVFNVRTCQTFNLSLAPHSCNLLIKKMKSPFKRWRCSGDWNGPFANRKSSIWRPICQMGVAQDLGL